MVATVLAATLAVAAVIGGAGLDARVGRAAAASPRFVGLAPARLLDTRSGAPTVDGAGSGAGPVGAATTIEVSVLGRGGVPRTGVAAAR